ncbi:MAG TPA: geranylgeranylglyceryl/heptaprenylglyceryl phosphate synthase [Fervidobacterium sp.]|nr:geranylgeranylglyceryl/heptaprenylglyceryl phosphate synthase [Fervidobacterium sp.]HPT54146.1 geranylgeranylglyceryl/heptaprenylglyceryl phosphate synthase [Fervidobacterium sp.]HPZ17336.1 geranylgeranylglyceryl/heptaprenylglyceryl phosphate synthase [Fervidobacterium sp.]HQE48065.1 geranylgeranylglyceryl/heptaprenylglyceryl phosphate synthase [Fervidobacterium sp.]HUM41858.1 geranylgeranylglyceryl/heptaprenylglyceryl phosphate synthase [Fervidobacterium sp.]
MLSKLNLKAPLIIASGPGGFGEYAKIDGFPWEYVGAYTLKTVTYNKKSGNVPPRMYARDGYMINRIGLENPGIDQFLDALENGEYEFLFKKTNVILSLGGDNYQEYIEVTKKVKPYLHKFIAVEYNFSCPNVSKGGLSMVTDLIEWQSLLVEIRKELPDTFLIAKLGIEGGFIENLVEKAAQSGWNGVTVINTIRGLMFNDDGEILLGGLSGPNLLPIAERAVYEVRKKLSDIYIISSGGVYKEEDAKQLLKVGADAVSIGSAIFQDEQIISRIGKYILENLKK